MNINDIQSEMRADGSHWWDHGTMRTWGTRVVGPVFEGDGGIFFATSDKQFDGSRAYTLRQYDRESKKIDTVGSLGDYRTRAKAIAAARKNAGANATADDSPLRPISQAEQFQSDLEKHTGRSVPRVLCNGLIRLATRHDALMVDYCNGVEVYDAEGEPLPRLRRIRDQITEAAESIGCGVRFQGDPRGVTVKLIMPDGATNDWGNEGWCVPTRETV